MDSKKQLREHFRKVRKELSDERKAEAKKIATATLLEKVCRARFVLSFASKHEEIDLWPLNEVLAQEKRLLLPNLALHGRIVPFTAFDLKEGLQLNKQWKVLEPDPKRSKQIAVEEIEIALIPGLAFDRGHGRLGYGQGHYDRFLQALSCPLIGVGFKEQLLDSPFAHEKHDIPLTEILLF